MVVPHFLFYLSAPKEEQRMTPFFFLIKCILSLCCSRLYCDGWVGKTFRISFIISEKCDKRQTRRLQGSANARVTNE